MKEGIALTDEVRSRIRSTLRNAYSPRHVPDEIIAVPDIPYTISGKKTETPVKKVLAGQDPRHVVSTGALRNPGSMEFFVRLGERLNRDRL
jgi:acetoacetyl-CoA synthetase